MISKVWKHEQNLSGEGLLELFPDHVRELLEAILQEGFILTLVGGGIRDYFLTEHFPTDLDFELRHPYQYNEKDWFFRIGHLEERLQKSFDHLGHKEGYKVELLSFSIMRIGWDNHEEEVELAPARIESYANAQGYGHSDMDVKLVSNASYEETFARRDFTLNAMGIEFYKKSTDLIIRFIDPFDGLSHLNSKELVPCGDHFSKDPVRFCRALRFSIKYDFHFSKKLSECLKEFNLTQLSAFYFFREAFKVDFFAFAKLFFKWVDAEKLPLGRDLAELSFLAKLGLPNLGLAQVQDILLFLIYYKGDSGECASIKEIQNFAKVAKLKPALIDGHINLKSSLEELEGLSPDQIREEVKDLSFSDFIKYSHKSALKRFHMSVNRYCNEEKDLFLLGRINSHLYSVLIRYSKLLPESLCGREEFQKMIDEQSIAPELRSDAQYYCHFKVIC